MTGKDAHILNRKHFGATDRQTGGSAFMYTHEEDSFPAFLMGFSYSDEMHTCICAGVYASRPMHLSIYPPPLTMVSR